jgi:Opacity family porin protein
MQNREMPMRGLTIVSVTCLALALGAVSARADSAIKFAGVGPTVGFISPSNLDGTFTIGGIVDLGTLAENVGLQATADYWGEKKSYNYGFSSADTKFRDIAFGGRVLYSFAKEGQQFHPYAGGGLSLHLVKVTADASYQGYPGFSASASDSKIGIDFVGGATFGKSEKMKWLGEAGYRVVSDYGQFVIRVGALFGIG